MEILNQAVAIVELLNNIWVVMENGDWVEVDSVPEQLRDLPVLNSNDIELEGNELVFPEGNKEYTVPQDIIAQLVTDLSQNPSDSPLSQNNNNIKISQIDGSQAEVAFKLISRHAQKLIPDSGYETTPDVLSEGQDEDFIEFIPDPIFTVDRFGGDNIFINKYEAVALEFSGTVENVADGEIVQIILSDQSGNEIIVTAVVQNGMWLVSNVDITTLDDGQITATVSLVGGNEEDAASETKIKDTEANIFIDFEDGLNTNSATEIEGEVEDVQDGQIVTVTILDASGAVVATYETTIIDGQWSIGSQPFADLADGDYSVQVSTIDIAGNDTQTQKSFTKDTTAVISVEISETDDGVINSAENIVLVSGTVVGIEDGQTVVVILQDADGNEITVNAIVENGMYQFEADISILNNGTITATASAQDLLGNSATAQDTVEQDKTASINVEIDKTSDGVLNGNAEDTNVTIRGSVEGIEDGQVVTVVVSDGINAPLTLTAIIVNGLYEITGIDLSTFNDGTITATATAQDLAGNSATSLDEVQHDNLIDTTFTVEDTDGVINSAEQSNVALSGTVADVEPGQQVTVTFIDSNGQQVIVNTEVDENGNWQISGDIESLIDGEISAQVSIFDAAGNEVTKNVALVKDTQNTLTLNIDKTNDGVVNGNSENTDLSLSGTVDGIEDGQEVTIILSDSEGNEVQVTAIVENGQYELTGIDISSLADGEITATANVADTAGNAIQAVDSFSQDSTAAITTSIDKTDDGIINGNGESAAIVVRGTVTDVEDGQTVTVIINDGVNPPIEVQATVQNGEYVTDPIDASALNDGTLTATATASDLAGNPVTAQDTVELDNTTTITTSIDKTDDGVINGNGESAAIVVRGTVTDVEDGQTVTVTISDGVNPPIEVQATVINGEYVTDPIDASALNDG
ncbi:hypothetical protein I6F65_19300, partial [Pseudoalteromonas sp. SWXJZ94C]|uniref:beta strand repeat-containing protein n=1 Tax=Pseudoalteromonas sp. SWXJZ94C TaxID=2792065 RepID=UPI001A285717